ncbi:aminopeptidase P family protein [Sedimentibacter hydroxybenzoicus DSM 7310]|uniref:Aminopeptidase P family protein n=1 Tax=Sedimentibacter hydroxybenzoicus DSM 7310 TaxID=1123245 RepID=A0A974GVT3_SEDHY|nr:Xaa-Pro peptidase family protein [Sedimentibacter hydroxybenzoicus]NYB73375.1 aminopeptidase P family protein [Sedimentibacter hydroxybenzoicus DSM 7310]
MNINLRNEYEQRIEKVRIEASNRGVDCLLIFGLAPRRVGDLMYLTGHQPMLPGHPRRYGFKGRGYSAIILPVEGNPCVLTTTPFYEKDLYISDVQYGDNLFEDIAREMNKRGLGKADIGIVGMDILAVTLYNDLQKELYQARFIPCDDIVMNLRATKSPYELGILRAGAQIADEVALLLRDYLRPGLSEYNVYQFITSELTKRGVTGAFATCQSGIRSETAYELVFASDKIIDSGDMVHMEINGKLDGYMIDICRSTVVGKSSPEQIRILDLVLHMFDQAVAAMKPGVTAQSLERITGKIALDNGFNKNHTNYYNGPATLLGHAIGLGVDEPPVLAEGDKTILRPGMVITVEPGLYNTGVGGCRIEDEVLVTENGCEILNTSGRKWW